MSLPTFRHKPDRSPQSLSSAFGTLGVEVFLNLYLGLLIAVPLFRGSYKDPRIKRLAVKSLASIFVVLASSSANLSAFSILGGHELGWLCLTLCTIDTFMSAASVFLVGPSHFL